MLERRYIILTKRLKTKTIFKEWIFVHVKSKDYIKHNQLVNTMIMECENRYKERGLFMISINLDEEYNIQRLYTILEMHISDRPKRELTTAIFDRNQILLYFDEHEKIPAQCRLLTTQVSENEYQHLMWYWECVKGIIESKIKLMQERL